MKKSELALSAAVGLAAGAFGGAAGVAIASWLAEAPKLLGGPWWDVVTAFGTIGSAAGAVAISFWAQQHSKKMELESSKRYALGSVDTMISACNDIQWALVLKKAASNYLDPVFERLPNEAYERVERAWIRLSSLDFERLSLAMPEQAGAFVKLKVNLRHEIDLLPRSKEDPYPLNDMVLNDIQADLKRMWDSILSSCQR